MPLMRPIMGGGFAAGGGGVSAPATWAMNILNGGFNGSLANWTQVGSLWRVLTANGPLTPYEGTHFADHTGSIASATLTQTVAVDADADFATILCQVALPFGGDENQMDLVWKDGGASTLRTDQSDVRQSRVDVWNLCGHVRVSIPSGAATVDIVLRAFNIGGSSPACAFDDVRGFWHDSTNGG